MDDKEQFEQWFATYADSAVGHVETSVKKHAALSAWQARAALTAPAAEVPHGVAAWIDDVLRDVAELPDRSSPEDEPDMMLVTADELRLIIEQHAPPAATAAEVPEAMGDEPALPETIYGLFCEVPGSISEGDEGYQEFLDEAGYTADQLRTYAKQYAQWQSTRLRGGVPERRLIGWRTENFLWETNDPDKARNWEPNVGVLPIFEGDPNTKLTAAPQAPAAALDAGVVRDVSKAARDVLAERQRQISAEGWTPEHDDAHGDGSMAVAASCYACSSAGLADATRDWPWADEWWKPSDRRRDLIKAGALILAEIERLDRAALSEAKAGGWVCASQAPKHPVCQVGNNHYSEYILAWWPGAIAPTRCRWWFRDDTDACNFLADGGYAVFPTVFQPLTAPPAQRGEG